ncbi:MAG: 2-oxoacid:acceptor oxidoreductase subunit alpha [Candidatus Micrarchaeia archaeon]
MNSVVIRIAGANGDGIESSGALLNRIAAKQGLHVFAYRGYQSIIRGGHLWYQIRISETGIDSYGDAIDVLVALNQDAIENWKSHLSGNAVVVYDPSSVKVDGVQDSVHKIPVPILDIAMKQSGNPVMRNVAAIGAVMKILGMDINSFDEVVKSTFGKKGEKVVSDNIKVANAGYGYEGVNAIFKLKGDGKARHVIDGNTALSIGAYAADCKMYFAYPMTPASSILHWFAAHEDKGVLFKQTEDEIAAINMTVGAASAGVRAMCGTSGGGFSLMVEGLGMAGMIEAPIVVVVSQRSGPSTGLPTKHSQADMLFVMHASQGEFPRIVVAPRTVEESFKIGAQAFNLADKYQCPVLILLDQFLSESYKSIDIENLNASDIKVDRGKIAQAAGSEKFERYAITDDGISPRSIPGTPGLEFVAATDEHDTQGNLISDYFAGIDKYVSIRKDMYAKRMRKMETMLKNESVFEPEIMNESAKRFLVVYGSTYGPAKEAVGMLNADGLDFGLVSFSYLLPLDEHKTKAVLEGKELIDVEADYNAQLAQWIRMNTGINIEHKIRKWDGEPFTAEEIYKQAKELAEIR